MHSTIAIVTGIAFGLGLALALLYWQGVSFGFDRKGEFQTRSKTTLITVLVAILAGVVVLAVTKWFVMALAVAGIIMFREKLFGAAAMSQRQIAELEALAMWTEALRDAISTGSGLLEALRSTTLRPPAALTGPLTDLSARLANREPLEDALRKLADDIDDPVADEVLAALILNARAQGRQLQAVLGGLAHSTRNTVAARREIEASRSSVRRGSNLIMVIIFAVTIGAGALAPSYSAAYQSAVGQMVLTLIIGMFFAGFFVMRQLSIIRRPRRFLTNEVH